MRANRTGVVSRCPGPFGARSSSDPASGRRCSGGTRRPPRRHGSSAAPTGSPTSRLRAVIAYLASPIVRPL
ncbi:hypothetical protein C8054_12555 [Micromonospora sp. RP3T]|nr:hypothetical protein C8054_12555 [Micromonospora sp. RP3T]